MQKLRTNFVKKFRELQEKWRISVYTYNTKINLFLAEMFFIHSANFSWMGENLSENEKQNRFRLHFRWLNENFAKEIKRKKFAHQTQHPSKYKIFGTIPQICGEIFMDESRPSYNNNNNEILKTLSLSAEWILKELCA